MHILDNEYLAVDDVLTLPRKGIVGSRKDVVLEPYIFNAPMDTVANYEIIKLLLEHGQYACVPRELALEYKKQCFREFGSHEKLFWAIGTKRHHVDEMIRIVGDSQEPINFMIDVAHGHSRSALRTIEVLRGLSLVRHIMSGSIATAEAATDCIKAGANFLRVGIGPGAACTTREMTGVGVPQLKAVYDVAQRVQHYRTYSEEDLAKEVLVVADGGIRNPGHANKYLAAGADAIMMGSEIGLAKEAPGWLSVDPQYYDYELRGKPAYFVKSYRGQASAEYQKDHTGEVNDCPEGESLHISRKPEEMESLEEIILRYQGGLRSAISYWGLIEQSTVGPATVDMIKITSNGLMEGKTRW